MKKLLFYAFWLWGITASAQTPQYDQTRAGFLVFHPIKTDVQGKIMPWFADDPGKSYSHVVQKVWDFWINMRTDYNGLPYYMNHQVWRPVPNDPRGVGGDQFSMALSSWRLLYQYTGKEEIRENMKFIADYYLTHSLSSQDAAWPDLPYPYNTLLYSGQYDGDMVNGKNITQPDKAGSFGYELVQMYQLISRRNWQNIPAERYLAAAINMANTLAEKIEPGDNDHSPLPFKVNALTGEVAPMHSHADDDAHTSLSGYTTNWVGTLQLFEELIRLKKGDTAAYQKAQRILLDWMKQYPLKTNKWGPFFEDIPGWSDTQINAVTFARYILEHRDLFPNWKVEVNGIFDWVYRELGNTQWEKYGVKVVNEQTAYQTPGNSHSARQAATELLYAGLSGDNARTENAIRTLHWATYMVDTDGKNNYPRDEVWLTDGYGDYVRHYLRAMAARPDLAPVDENHILCATSVLNQVDYAPHFNKTLSPDVPNADVQKVYMHYYSFDQSSVETIRLVAKPGAVKMGRDFTLRELKVLNEEGYTWQPLSSGGGILRVRHDKEHEITVFAQF
ncbi:MAG: hypothetical protein LH618_04380 [Saprospiraceae bacterium]|nr:hypothetical protein [Saprospiraceae bacterium]